MYETIERAPAFSNSRFSRINWIIYQNLKLMISSKAKTCRYWKEREGRGGERRGGGEAKGRGEIKMFLQVWRRKIFHGGLRSSSSMTRNKAEGRRRKEGRKKDGRTFSYAACFD